MMARNKASAINHDARRIISMPFRRLARIILSENAKGTGTNASFAHRPGHATSYHHSSVHCPWARRTHGRRCAFGTTFAQPPSSEKIKNLTRLFPGKTPLPHLLSAQKGSPMRITPGPMGGPTCARTTHPRHRILFCALSVFAAPFFIHHSPPPTGVPFYRTNPISCAILSHDSPPRAAKLSTCPKTQPTGGSPNFRIH
jgi:hypothetical protein